MCDGAQQVHASPNTLAVQHTRRTDAIWDMSISLLAAMVNTECAFLVDSDTGLENVSSRVKEPIGVYTGAHLSASLRGLAANALT